jgi:hypothetical protein
VAQPFDQGAGDSAPRNPVRLSVVLNGFGGAAIILAILFFGGSFYVENEIGRAFCLGAFFSGLLGGIVLFGFAKIIEMLDAIRQQTIVAQGEGAQDAKVEANAAARVSPPHAS